METMPPATTHWKETKDRHGRRVWASKGEQLLFISLNFSLFQLISGNGTFSIPLRNRSCCLIVCLPLTVWLMRLMQSGNYSFSWFSR